MDSASCYVGQQDGSDLLFIFRDQEKFIQRLDCHLTLDLFNQRESDRPVATQSVGVRHQARHRKSIRRGNENNMSAPKLEPPFVSIIVVSYNSRPYLEACLGSLLATDYPRFEVIIVDNASTDGSLDFVREHFGPAPRLKILLNATNIGASRGRNVGIVTAVGEYLSFLDSDTYVDPGWLTALIAAFVLDKGIGASQSKLLLAGQEGVLDSCGHHLAPWGFPFEVGSRELDRGQYDRITNIFGAKSAAMTIRRDVLERVRPFDPDYFIYGEETDLCWRIWLSGYRVVFVPSSVVYHRVGGTLNEHSRHLVAYEGAKNSTKNLIKNLSLVRLLYMLPFHTLAWICVAIVLLLKGRPQDAAHSLRGIIWNARHLRRVWSDRQYVQRHIRRISDPELFQAVRWPHRSSYLFIKGMKWLGRL